MENILFTFLFFVPILTTCDKKNLYSSEVARMVCSSQPNGNEVRDGATCVVLCKYGDTPLEVEAQCLNDQWHHINNKCIKYPITKDTPLFQSCSAISPGVCDTSSLRKKYRLECGEQDCLFYSKKTKMCTGKVSCTNGKLLPNETKIDQMIKDCEKNQGIKMAAIEVRDKPCDLTKTPDYFDINDCKGQTVQDGIICNFHCKDKFTHAVYKRICRNGSFQAIAPDCYNMIWLEKNKAFYEKRKACPRKCAVADYKGSLTNCTGLIANGTVCEELLEAGQNSETILCDDGEFKNKKRLHER